MGLIPGVFGFPANPRVAEVGAVVVGALAQFVTKAGKIAASLVTVDGSGNVATPGTVTATATRVGGSDAAWAQVCHPTAAAATARVDEAAATATVCIECGGPMRYEPYVKFVNGMRTSYRAFAVCNWCDHAVEF